MIYIEFFISILEYQNNLELIGEFANYNMLISFK